MGKGKDVTPRKRARIEVLLRESGRTQEDIARIVGVSPSYVAVFAKKLKEGKPTSPQRVGKCGRKRATSPRMDAFLLRKARQNRASTSTQLQEVASEHGTQISARTVRRRLFDSGLKARRPRKKQKLTATMIKQRLAWAKSLKDWTSDDWSKVCA